MNHHLLTDQNREFTRCNTLQHTADYRHRIIQQDQTGLMQERIQARNRKKNIILDAWLLLNVLAWGVNSFGACLSVTHVLLWRSSLSTSRRIISLIQETRTTSSICPQRRKGCGISVRMVSDGYFYIFHDVSIHWFNFLHTYSVCMSIVHTKADLCTV